MSGLWCIRVRAAAATGRGARGAYARDPYGPPLFIARGRKARIRFGDAPADLWHCRTRAGAEMVARSPAVRAATVGRVVDVVSLRFAIGWSIAACEVSGGLTDADRAEVARLRRLDAAARRKGTR